MPTLKQINCSIELGPSNTKLKEYGARYSDGHVESFVAVPESDVPFSIHLQSEGYIAPGIAFFVFTDGEYQCNRNRIGLKLPLEDIQPGDYETEFRVRQKEEKTSFGTFVVRDWTFAKLNKVSADKAPSLNPQFTHNVGTIEVIVLRCQSDVDEIPPPRATWTKNAQKAPSVTKAKHPSASKPAPAASVKSGTQQQSGMGDLGGFFGLFDGVCDDINLDGTGDERPVGPDGRVKPDPPPGMEWDPIVGTWVPKGCTRPPTDLPSVSEIKRQIEAFKKRTGEMGAQVDGHESRPNVVINQWGDRGRDDMRGDKYLGLQGQDRSAYKQYMREGGESVSSHARNTTYPRARMEADEPFKHAMPPRQAAPQVNCNTMPIHIPIAPNPREIANVLNHMRKKIEQDIEYLPNDEQGAARRAFGMVTHLQGLLQQGAGTLARFPTWLTEVLTDMELRRQYMLRATEKHPHVDLSDLEDQLDEQREQALCDRLLWKDYRADKLEDCLAMSLMFAERAAIFEEFIKNAEGFSKRVSTGELRARMRYVSMQRDKASEMVQKMMDQAETANIRTRSPHQQVGYGYGDAAGGWGAQPKGSRVDSAQPPWQQLGVGTWNSGQDAKQDVGQPANDWSYDKQRSHQQANNAGNAWGWQDSNNNNDNKSHKSGSRKTHEHDFGNQSAKNGGGWGNSQKGRSQQGSIRQDNGISGWNDNKSQSKNNEDQGWGAPAGNDNGGDNWNANQSQEKSRSGSVRSSRSVRPARSESLEPSIKPYWKDWKMTFDRSNTSEDPLTLRKYQESREVYNYPASPLPAVAAKEAKDVSHGIQASRGADYSHKCRAPVYIDTMERPYAVFSFKYRSREKLEKILKLKIDDVDIKKVQQQVEKDRLMTLPKHKLIDELMKKRGPTKADSKKPEEKDSSKAADGWGDADGGSKKGSAQGDGWGGSIKGGWDGDDDKKSSHSYRTASRHSDRKSQRSQNGNADGWGDGSRSKASSKADQGNGWDQDNGFNNDFDRW